MKHVHVSRDVRMRALMEQIRRRIARRLRAGEALSSSAVVMLSERLDRLVLACYRNGYASAFTTQVRSAGSERSILFRAIQLPLA